MTVTCSAAPQRGMRGEIQKAVHMAVLHHLLALSANEAAAPSARAQAHMALVTLRKEMPARRFPDQAWAKVIPVPRPLEPPPGQPIGCLMA